jgi:hypothetical protein
MQVTARAVLEDPVDVRLPAECCKEGHDVGMVETLMAVRGGQLSSLLSLPINGDLAWCES